MFQMIVYSLRISHTNNNMKVYINTFIYNTYSEIVVFVVAGLNFEQCILPVYNLR